MNVFPCSVLRWESHLAILWFPSCSVLGTSGKKFGRLYGMPRIKSKLAKCKTISYRYNTTLTCKILFFQIKINGLIEHWCPLILISCQSNFILHRCTHMFLDDFKENIFCSFPGMMLSMNAIVTLLSAPTRSTKHKVRWVFNSNFLM